MGKKVLVVGGTGTMGCYLVPKLVTDGWFVDVLTLDNITSNHQNLRYFKANAFDLAVINEILYNKYDAVVDFMVYNTKIFQEYAKLYLDNTEHYIYLSSYRVFADKDKPIVESSPQLVDVSEDEELRASDDYCIFKALGEKHLRNSGCHNWTIVRPVITYSQKRCQLMTYERHHLLPFIKSGKPIPLYEGALSAQTTMCWAGDVAEMLKRLLLNERALCEDFNVTTSEHHSWSEVADYYGDLFGLKYIKATEKEYFIARGDYGKASLQAFTWQLRYDRMFDRIMDNSKILKITGMKQEELTTLYEGLKRERKILLE